MEEESDPTTNGQPSIAFWELATANPEQLVDVTAEHAQYSTTGEVELLGTLLETLKPLRYQDAVLLTPTQRTLRMLRLRLAETHPETASLRGLNHISIENVLAQHFGQDFAAYSLNQLEREVPRRSERDNMKIEHSEAPRRLWDLWVDVFRLLPPQTLKGDLL